MINAEPTGTIVMRRSQNRRTSRTPALPRRVLLYVGNMGTGLGHNVTVIETLGKRLEQRYVVHRVSARTNRLARLMDMLLSVVRLRARVSIVLIDTYGTTGFLYALAVAELCRLLAIPYIPILHGGRLQSRLTSSPRLSRNVFLHSKTNIAPSPYLARAFRSSSLPVAVIPNSIAISDYRFRQRDHFRPRLLFVRSFARIYNPEMAVRALVSLARRYPHAELCMVGPDRDGLQRRCLDLVEAHDCADKVVFAGILEKSEWHRLSAHFDLFINTSDIDNMPVSLIEAMALGLPVVSTDAGGIPDLIEDRKDGLLVPCNDPDGMAEAIVRIIEDPDLGQKLALNAREKAEAFDWERVKEDWFRLLG